jgi:acyl-CoA synthetase (NDP forming)
MATDTAFTDLVGTLLADPKVDAAVVGIVPLTPAMQTLAAGDAHRESVLDPGSVCQLLPEVARTSGKPVVAVVDSGVLFDPMEAALESGGLPVFRSADRAMRALCRWVDVRIRRRSS